MKGVINSGGTRANSRRQGLYSTSPCEVFNVYIRSIYNPCQVSCVNIMSEVILWSGTCSVQECNIFVSYADT